MNMMKNKYYILLSSLGAIVVLWQLLGSGYVLTLDMIFGPQVAIVGQNSLLSGAPYRAVFYVLTELTSGWITQKIVLISLFFSLFFLPLYFFRRIFRLERTYGAEYVASLVFVINPFVYERFLAGQWAVLAGYALLLPVFAFALALIREPGYRNSLKLAGSLLVLGMFSVHIFTMVMLMLVGGLGVVLLKQKGSVMLLKRILLVGVLVVVGSSYWLVPALSGSATPLQTFTAEHYEVFKTASDDAVGTVGNVLLLHGFWGEREPWIERFLVPKVDGGKLFWVGFSALMILVLYGLYHLLRNRERRIQAVFMIVTALLAVVFSAGIGEGVFREFNLWLFENVSFWKGFRDTQKWSAVLVLVYSLFAGYGSVIILEKVRSSLRNSVLFGLLAIPIIVTPMILFGFAGQFQAVHYPESWERVNAVLSTQEPCKVLFLPWQQYYSLQFNDNHLVANTAGSYFDCEVVAGKNMQLGSIESQGGYGEEYELIEAVMMNNNIDPDIAIAELEQLGITHIVFTGDISEEDPYIYPFLGSGRLKKILGLQGGRIDLYSI